MSACNIIVDSCSYFRLAQSIKPLLKISFGREKHCLGVIDELDKEYERKQDVQIQTVLERGDTPFYYSIDALAQGIKDFIK